MKPEAYRKAYAQMLRTLKAGRLHVGMTQAQAAAALGQPQSFISKCESGERRIDFVELQEMARLYGLSIRSFE